MDIKKFASSLLLEEKATLVSGMDFWHLEALKRFDIPAILMTDGPHGLRKEIGESDAALKESVPATCFPTASCLASTWSRDLISRVGQAIAEEAKSEGVSVVLGPGANIKRSPLCGRNFEYFSEDPLLSGEMAASWIKGLQGAGVGASLKHFAANNQEYLRMSINAVIDERALREIYLAGFEAAVRQGQPWTVMAAYNQLNGTFCTENHYLLSKILREEWGFEGLVMSDWGAVNDRAAGLSARLDLEMPGVKNGNAKRILELIQDGFLEEETLNLAVKNVLDLIDRSMQNLDEGYRYDADAHHELARKAAAEGAVLLKNKDNLLPLKRGMNIALLGGFARHPRYQGSGSSRIIPTRLDTLYDEMLKTFGKEHITYLQGYPMNEGEDMRILLQQAVSAARLSDAVVICAGLPDRYEVEGVDRDSLSLPDTHSWLIEAAALVSDRITVVLSNGAPVEMPWLDRVSSVLECYLGGQASAGAAADILSGAVNPSGKLAETFPLQLADTPCYRYFPGGPETVEYRESIYVGYRFYDTVGKKVLFPFGHGLSYTEFEYADLKTEKNQIRAEENLMVTLKVRNSRKRAGSEVVQVYIRKADSEVFRPEKELKAFSKIALKPGEEKEIQFTLDERTFAFFNTKTENWQVERGTYQILAGSSSRDIRLCTEIEIISGRLEETRNRDEIPDAYFDFPSDGMISQQDFERLLGMPVPENRKPKRGEYTINTPISQMKGTLTGRLIGMVMKQQMEKMVLGQEDSPNAIMMRKMAEEGPLRIMLMSGVDRDVVDAVLLMANGKFLKGLAALRKATANKIK